MYACSRSCARPRPSAAAPASRRMAACGHALAVATLFAVAQPAVAAYVETDLVSDLPGRAAVLDPNLVNPWGLSAGPTTPWWVSDNGSGLSTLYNGNTGAPLALVVTIPPAGSAPTGQVFNGSATDFLLANGQAARFLFATEGGTIAGWNGGLGTTAAVAVDNSGSGASYKGLALANNGSGSFLYAADFAGGRIDVFNAAFAQVAAPGGFTDPNLPSGYAPFNVQNLGGTLYVAYAQRSVADPDEEQAGAGLGIVDAYDADGTLLRRVATGGVLDAPWGLALAPAHFGEFSNALLVGNFGDGRISAYDALTGALLGQLTDAAGQPIAIEGLWGIGFGNGAAAGPAGALYFAAGINDEANGLFGVLTAVPEPSLSSLLVVGLAALRGRWRTRR